MSSICALAQTVKIGDTEITEGTHYMYGGIINYYPGILTLNDVTINDGISLDGNIAVVVEGQCTINVDNGDGIDIAEASSVHFVSATSNDVITIKAPNDAIRVGAFVTLNIGSEEKVLTMELKGGNHAIFCNGLSSNLFITKAFVHAIRGTSDDVIGDFYRLDFIDCNLYNPIGSGVTYNYSEYHRRVSSELSRNVLIGFVTETYDLKVGETVVNNLNALDINLYGAEKYDNVTKTLSIGRAGGTHMVLGGSIESGIQDLKVIINGQVKLFNSLHATADITLTTTSDESNLMIESIGPTIINEGCNLCIDGNDHVLGLSLMGEIYGIKGISTADRDATLTIRNAQLSIDHTFEGAIVGQASADLSNETVAYPYRALIKDGTLVDKDFKPCTDVVRMIPGKQYPLWYNGSPVTEFNSQQINLIDNRVTYDVNSKTLNVDGFSISADKRHYPLIDSDVDGLRIVFNNYNEIGSICPDGVIHSTARFSLETAEGAYCSISSTDGPAIINEACEATIGGAGLLYLSGTTGIMGKSTKNGDSSLLLRSSEIRIKTTLKGAIVGQKDINMMGIAVKEPYYLYVKDGALVDDNGNPYTKEVKLSPAETYNIWLAGRHVNEFNMDDILHSRVSRAEYNPFEKRLSLSNVKVETDDRNVLRSVEDGLTIELSGQNTLKTTAEDGRGIYLQHNTRIVSPLTSVTTISAGQTGIETARGVSLSIGDSESDNMKLEIMADEYGILGTESRMANPLNITKANISIENTQKAAVSGFSAISLSGVDILQEDATIKGGNVVDDMGLLYSGKLDIGMLEQYDIFVAGVEVNALNKDDILGDGSAKYDPERNILTLKGTISCDEANVLEIFRPITLHGDGPVKLVGNDVTTILCSGADLTIEDMDLTCSSYYEAIYVEDEGLLRIANSTVNLQSDNYSAIDLGSNELWLRSSTLNIVGNGKKATINDCANIMLEVCEITSNNYFDAESSTFISNTTGNAEKGSITIMPNGNTIDAYLYVLGVPVTRFNSSDIMGDGKMYYDEETKELIVNNVNIEDKSSEPVIDAMDDITIYFNGLNTIGSYSASAIRNKYGTTTIYADTYIDNEMLVLASLSPDSPTLDLYGKLTLKLGTMLGMGNYAFIDLHGKDMEITTGSSDTDGLEISADPTVPEEERNPLVRNCGSLLLHDCGILMGTYFSRTDHTFHASDGEVQKSDILIKYSDTAVAISDISTSHEESHAIYDLQGRRIPASLAKHGIYIINGKKVVR